MALGRTERGPGLNLSNVEHTPLSVANFTGVLPSLNKACDQSGSAQKVRFKCTQHDEDRDTLVLVLSSNISACIQ